MKLAPRMHLHTGALSAIHINIYISICKYQDTSFVDSETVMVNYLV